MRGRTWARNGRRPGGDTMSTVSATGFGTATASAQKTAANVDYQSFIKLLVAELANQDPLEPVDAAQHVAQLASFSNVEQSLQINAKIGQVLEAANLSLAGSIIGRTLTSADGSVSGTIASVSIGSDGLVATLGDGQEVAVAAGIVISG